MNPLSNRPDVVPVSQKAHVQDIQPPGLSKTPPGLDEDHLSENAAAPIARVLKQVRKDIANLTDSEGIEAITHQLMSIAAITAEAPFNPYKQLHFFKRILEKANVLLEKGGEGDPVLGEFIDQLQEHIASLEEEA